MCKDALYNSKAWTTILRLQDIDNTILIIDGLLKIIKLSGLYKQLISYNILNDLR